MKEIKEELEKIQFEVYVAKDLSIILDEHFQANRYKDNVVMDHWSLTHLFSEYTTLHYEVSKKLNDIDKLLTNLISKVFDGGKVEQKILERKEEKKK